MGTIASPLNKLSEIAWWSSVMVNGPWTAKQFKSVTVNIVTLVADCNLRTNIFLLDQPTIDQEDVALIVKDENAVFITVDRNVLW